MNKPADSKLFDGVVAPEKLPDWLTQEDLDTYVEAFEKSGFRGPLNRYRNMDRDWEELPQLGGATVQQPALYIAGEKDPVATFAPMDPMKAVGAESEEDRDDSGLRPLDAAGGAGARQRRADRVPAHAVGARHDALSIRLDHILTAVFR